MNKTKNPETFVLLLTETVFCGIMIPSLLPREVVMPKNTVRDSVVIRDYLVIAAGSVLYAAALCLFVYPRSFSFG